LQAALDKDPTAVQGLFATATRTDDSLVSFVKAGDNTRAGLFPLNVTQLATQGKAVGGASAGLTIDNTNDTLDLNVNGTATSIKLSQRTYTNAAALASELQSQINGSAALLTAGSKVTVSENAGVFTITSDKYGSASKVQLSGGNALAGLFGTPTSTNGLDVAGTLGLGGATGNGQDLTSSDGLSVKITGGNTGERGNVTLMRGIATQLDKLIGDALDSKGTVPARIDTLNQQVKDIENKRVFIEKQLEVKEQRYLNQFNSLDGLLSNMQSTMSYMAQQLSALNNGNK
ncbi:MAG TPA: flagellar filament capping protein FliD, partial [Polyangiales bacterium]|nr:flagellar filament capping protein FliD [Polyangiales bacterium]